MALTYKLVSATSQFTAHGVALRYAVELYDDHLGFVGSKGFDATDPGLLAQVLAAAQDMLPMIDVQVGLPGGLPTRPDAVVTPTPMPPTSDTATVAPVTDSK